MNDSTKQPEQDVNRNTIDVYKEMLAVERNKSAIYANLWTILITALAGLLGFYLNKPDDNYSILLMIPFLLGIWAAFAGFNLLYLTVLRSYIKVIENNIEISVKNADGNSVLWIKDIFYNAITKNASIYLSIVVSLFFLIILIFIISQIVRYWVQISGIIQPSIYFIIIGFLYLALFFGFYFSKKGLLLRKVKIFKTTDEN